MTPAALANLAIGLAFVLSLAFSPGTLFVQNFLDGPVHWGMTGIARQLPPLLGNYWIPALAIYLLLRYGRFADRYRIPALAHAFIGAGNAMLFVYLAIRIGASAIPGGGAGFAVAAIGSWLIVIPGYACLLVGLYQGTKSKLPASERLASGDVRTGHLGVGEGLGILAAAAVPVAGILWLYSGSDSPYRLARDAERLLDARCKSASEKVLRKLNGVKGIFLERDDGFMFGNLRDGVYDGTSFGSIGNAMLDRGSVDFYEIRRPSGSRTASTDGRYLRFSRNSKSPVAANEVLSEYELQWRDIATAEEKRLGVSGSELAIADRGTGERTAITRFFISSRHRKICGQFTGNSFGVIQFIDRAIGAQTNVPQSR